jgi:hypothetical protein
MELPLRSPVVSVRGSFGTKGQFRVTSTIFVQQFGSEFQICESLLEYGLLCGGSKHSFTGTAPTLTSPHCAAPPQTSLLHPRALSCSLFLPSCLSLSVCFLTANTLLPLLSSYNLFLHSSRLFIHKTVLSTTLSSFLRHIHDCLYSQEVANTAIMVSSPQQTPLHEAHANR